MLTFNLKVILRAHGRARIIEFLVKHWRIGNRNRLEMAFLGWFLKKGLSFDSAYRMIDQLMMLAGDEERAQRLQLVKYHYQTGRSMTSQLLGISGLREIFKEGLM